MHRQSERFYASIIKAFCNSRGSEPRKPMVERDGNRRDEEKKKKGGKMKDRERRWKEWSVFAFLCV